MNSLNSSTTPLYDAFDGQLRSQLTSSILRQLSNDNTLVTLMETDKQFADSCGGQKEEGALNKVLEPSPIKSQDLKTRTHKLINDLPDFITRYCDDYIQVLSKLGEEDSENENSFTSSSFSCAPQAIRSDDGAATSVSSDSSERVHLYQIERWTERFRDLVEYSEMHGHFNVKQKENPALFQWVKRQRHQYKLRKISHRSNLTLDRIQMLEDVGFVWDSHRAAWDEKFDELKEFKDLHGHCFVPCKWKGNSKLSTWIKRQRRQYRKIASFQHSALDEERIKELENIGFPWDYYSEKESMV